MPAGVRTLPFLNVLVDLVMMIAALYWPNAVVIPVALALLMTFLLTPIVKVGQRLATFAPHAASRLA
jgi:predicted PurR-regulated permease PerM